MTHYRLYKLDRKGGRIIKGKDLEEANDEAALCEAHQDPDCPECEVWQSARKVGSITK